MVVPVPEASNAPSTSSATADARTRHPASEHRTGHTSPNEPQSHRRDFTCETRKSVLANRATSPRSANTSRSRAPIGLYAAIGIRKGQPFAPGARMRQTLAESVAVGNAYARSNAFASRDPRTRIFRGRQWLTPFVGGSYPFLSGAERLLDAQAMFFYAATGITPAMSDARPGTGSAYALAFRDAADGITLTAVAPTR
jgi:hypothetical protein